MCIRDSDNVVYLLGWANSRAEARQLVTHGHYEVNGKKVNIPSYLIKAGDVITVREASRSSSKIKGLIEDLDSRIFPKWLDVDKNTATAKVTALPTREDIEFPFEEHLIVELYSK